jgi:uncharacterized protein YndB with AHSA1/START domain
MQAKPNEIRIVRVYNAPVKLVWEAWTDLQHVEKWWGPRGFTLTTHNKELRTGGYWRYTMHGPDGKDWPNYTRYLEIEPLKKMVYDHGASDENAPPLFRVTVTFADLGDGRTEMVMTSAFATPELAEQSRKFIKLAGGNSTWDRLAEYLEEQPAGGQGRRTFIINRSFPAPAARVFDMWSHPEYLAKWLPPPGMTMRFIRPDIAAGKSALFVMAGEQGSMHVRTEYLAIEPPARIVYTQQFVDEQERPAAAPGTETWPPVLRNTVLFTEEEPGVTRVTLTTEVEGKATSAEMEAFVLERSGMTQGWSASFDVLEELLA